MSAGTYTVQTTGCTGLSISNESDSFDADLIDGAMVSLPSDYYVVQLFGADCSPSGGWSVALQP